MRVARKRCGLVSSLRRIGLSPILFLLFSLVCFLKEDRNSFGDTLSTRDNLLICVNVIFEPPEITLSLGLKARI